MMQKIKFQGEEWLLVDNSITTEDRFKHGIVSHAHICKDGIIRRYNQEIGAKDDIEIIEEIEDVEIASDGIENLLLHRSWF